MAAHAVPSADQASTIGVAGSIPELLPNYLFELPGGAFVANSQSVVVAEPVSIRPEKASAWGATGDGGDEQTVDFDDPRAQARTWIVQLRVSELVAGRQPKELLPQAVGANVQVRLASQGGEVDVDRFESGVLGLKQSVWFLGAYADLPSDAFVVPWDSKAVGAVSDDGSLEFKLLQPQERKDLHENRYSVEDLRRLAAEATHRIGREK